MSDKREVNKFSLKTNIDTGANPISINDRVNPNIIRNYYGNTRWEVPNRKKTFKLGLERKSLAEFIERFEYENLPEGLTKDLIERILFYRGKGIFFEFYGVPMFLPFTLKSDGGNANLDSYGRFKVVTPFLFTGVAEGKERALANGDFAIEPVYDKIEREYTNPGVILYDSPLGIGQENPRMVDLLEPYLGKSADIYTMISLAVVNSGDVYMSQVEDESQIEAFHDEMQDFDSKILSGQRFFGIASTLDMKPFARDKSGSKASDLYQVLQSNENLRKSLMGIESGGTFLKKEHMTDNETETNSSGGTLVLKSSLRLREEFCDLINHVFGYDISVKEIEQNENKEIAEEGSQTLQRKEQGGGGNDV